MCIRIVYPQRLLLFRKIIDIRKEVAVLDLGTDTTCAAIAKIERKDSDALSGFGKGIRILGIGYQLTKGIKRGAITNLEDLEDSLIGSILTAEKEAQKNVKSVFVSIPSWAIVSRAIDNSIEIGQVPVDDVHVNSLMNFDCSRSSDPTMEMIHIFPISYSIDENDGIHAPLGMVGEILSGTFHVMYAKSSLLQNIKNCLSRNNIDVEGFICSTYASVLSVLLEDETISGVTLIDIGGTTTSICCINDGTVLYLGTIPVGSQNVTNDIAMVLRTSKSNAERLKILYGVSAENPHYEEEQILVSRIDEYGEEHIQNISKGMLNSIIAARFEEMLESVEKHIETCGADKLLYQRIVITGGGSRISGLTGLIRSRRYFNGLSVRLGKPVGTIGSHDFVQTASFATAAGAAMYCLGELQGISSIRQSLYKKSFRQKLITWFKRGV
ncbi:MAG: cell division protein FtsA [Holosporales bacterium]|jgi:cell division protein FtsA|nr:cell division protein FtsA [Holosporales bacterium]